MIVHLLLPDIFDLIGIGTFRAYCIASVEIAFGQATQDQFGPEPGRVSNFLPIGINVSRYIRPRDVISTGMKVFSAFLRAPDAIHRGLPKLSAPPSKPSIALTNSP
jgi:hypothetical protein